MVVVMVSFNRRVLDRVDAIWDGLEQMLEEFPRDLAICFIHELLDCKFAGPVNAYKEIELALGGLNLGNVDVEEPDGLALELLSPRFVALDIR